MRELGGAVKRGGLGLKEQREHKLVPPGDGWPFALSSDLSLSDKSEPESFLTPLVLR